MNRATAATVVVAGHRSSNKTKNEPPSVSISVIKSDETRDLEKIQRYLDQQEDLSRNVQDVNSAVISMKEILAGFQQQLATVTEKNRALKDVNRSQYTTEFLTVHRVKIKLREEAEALWQLEPDEKRLIKRWFRKSVENHMEKDRFIRNFVDTNFEKSLRTEIDD